MGWIALTVLLVVLGFASILPVLMAPMLFDAPGSTANPFTVGVAVAIVALPMACFLGAGLPWAFAHRPFAKMFFLLPILDLALIVLLFFCLDYFHGGMLGGGNRSG